MKNKKYDTLAKNLQKFMDKKSVTRYQLADELDLKYSTLSEWLQGRKYPRIDKLDLLANYFNITISELIEDSIKPPKVIETPKTLKAVNDVTAQLKKPRQHKVLKYAIKQLDAQNNEVYNVNNDIREDETEYSAIKLYGAVSAGKGVALYEEYTDVITYPKPIPEHDIALQVNGDSMLPLFRDGEIIFINKTYEINHGQIGVFILNGQGFLKKFYKIDNDVRLLSVNETYQDITINEQDDLRLIGTVVF